MRVGLLLKWSLIAALASCRELFSTTSNDPGACQALPKTAAGNKRQAAQRHGGIVLMQKGMSLAQVRPDSMKPGSLEIAQQKKPNISSWAATVMNASASATRTYADLMNSSGLMTSHFVPVGGEEHMSFLYKHWSLVVAVSFVLALVSCICIFDLRWTRKQKAEEHDSNLAARTESFSLGLVHHLLPSAKIDRHQFRGLTKKSSSITLGFEDVGLEIPGHGKVLEGVSGEFKAGHLSIILGPSGAGKSTLLRVLCGKATSGKMCGKVQVNGVESKLSDFKSVIGFVPQDDIVHEKLTVREQIAFSAQLRNAAGTDAATLQHIVDDVLAVLQIEHIQRSMVGDILQPGISGGQRKRVNIGLELAAFPTLLFLDEPTSGLDSTSALALVKSLKKMTQLGITIVVVAHQPRWSLFSLFDDVLILAKGGRTAYMGPSPCVCSYFESLGFKKPGDENPADWLMDVVSGSVPNPRVPKFSSGMLVSSWEERDKQSELWSAPRVKLLRSHTRTWTAHDDRAVLAQALEDEWARVDAMRVGILSIGQLTTLLSNTAGDEPSEEVVSDLARQMAGQATKSVTKAQFVDYLVALEQSVTASAKPFIDTADIHGHQGSSAQDLLSLPDLMRVTPGFLTQFSTLLRRRMVQVTRNNKQRGIDVCLIVSVSLFLGWINRSQMTFHDPFFASKILVFHLGLCLLVTVSCLRTFGADRPMWWREFSSGLNIPAFFCARMAIDTLDVFLQCLLYSSMYFLLAQPPTPFRLHFLPCLYLSLAASGWGYLISVSFPPQNAALVAILFSLVTNGFLGDPGAAHGYLSLLSMSRWSAQMTYLACADVQGSFVKGGIPPWVRDEIVEVATNIPANPMNVFKACGIMSSSMVEAGYRSSSINSLFGHWYSASGILLFMAIVLRILTFAGMRFLNRGKFA